MKDEIIQLIRQEINADKQSAQYNVSKVPTHVHNNLDSPQVHFPDLGDSNKYIVLNRITLLPAQIKVLHTTPITIVPVPLPAMSATNARTVVIVESITGYIEFNATAYTGANALEFRYTGASGAKVTADISTTFLNASANAYVQVAGITTELVPVSNASITISVPTANPAAGDSPITFIIKYRLVSF